MKYYNRLVFFLLFIFSSINILAQSSVVTFSAIEIKPDTSLLKIIKRHLFIMKERGLTNSQDKITFLEITPAFTIEDGLSQKILDSIYNINDFTLNEKEWKDKGIYPPKYKVLVKTEYLSYLFFETINFQYKNVFYCKYQDWNIIIVSNLTIKMSNISESKRIDINITRKKHNTIRKKNVNYSSSVTLFNNTTVFYFTGNFMNPYEKFMVTIRPQDKVHSFDYYYCKRKKILVKKCYEALYK